MPASTTKEVDTEWSLRPQRRKSQHNKRDSAHPRSVEEESDQEREEKEEQEQRRKRRRKASKKRRSASPLGDDEKEYRQRDYSNRYSTHGRSETPPPAWSTRRRTKKASSAASSDQKATDGKESMSKAASAPEPSSSRSSVSSAEFGAVDKSLYAIAPHLQGTATPAPRPKEPRDIPWSRLKLLEEIPCVHLNKTIHTGNILRLTRPVEGGLGEPFHGKVLEMREHPTGGYHLLVAFYVHRKTVANALFKLPKYLARRWPVKEKEREMITCEYGVVDIERVMDIMLLEGDNGNYFIKDRVYGHSYINYEIFSATPDPIERKEVMKGGMSWEERSEEEELQAEIVRLLLE